MNLNRRDALASAGLMLFGARKMDLISIERRNEPHVIFAARSPDYPSGRYSTAFSNKTVKSWFEEYWGSRRNVQSVFGEISEFGFLKNILFPKTFRKLTPNVVDFPTHLETAITEDFYNASVTVKDNAVELVSATDIHGDVLSVVKTRSWSHL